jgi:AraC-like DNA-binding protein
VSEGSEGSEPQALLDPDRVALPAFGLAEDLPALDGDWHLHERPQLLYASAGAMRLYTEQQVAVLPPQRAAWIGGGVRHRVACGRPVSLRTVYFPPSEALGAPLKLFEAPPLLREMALQAAAWGQAPPPGAGPFFRAFLWLVRGWSERALPVELPAARSEPLQRALDKLSERLSRPVGLSEAARWAGMSPRTFQRRCREELGVGLAVWLKRARALKALELLADPELPVGEVAMLCGYQSPSAFTRAFRELLGSPPGDWRGQQ